MQGTGFESSKSLARLIPPALPASGHLPHHASGTLTDGGGVISGSKDQLRGPVVAGTDVRDIGLPPNQLLCTVGREERE